MILTTGLSKYTRVCGHMQPHNTVCRTRFAYVHTRVWQHTPPNALMGAQYHYASDSGSPIPTSKDPEEDSSILVKMSNKVFLITHFEVCIGEPPSLHAAPTEKPRFNQYANTHCALNASVREPM